MDRLSHQAGGELSTPDRRLIAEPQIELYPLVEMCEQRK
jgi:hypothetical protein